MINDIILILGSLGFTILMTKKEGPFNILTKFRNFIWSNKIIGVFLYQMMNCGYCSAFWFGLLFHTIVEGFSRYSIVFSFACAFTAYILSFYIDTD